MKKPIVFLVAVLMLSLGVKAQQMEDVQRDIVAKRLEKTALAEDLKKDRKEMKKADAATKADMREEIARERSEKKKISKAEQEDKMELAEQKQEAGNAGRNAVDPGSVAAFKKTYGNRYPAAVWVKGKFCDEVTFTENGQKKTIYYDDDAQITGVTTEKAFRDLPAESLKYLDNKYSGYRRNKVLFFDATDDADDCYFANLSAADGTGIVLKVSMSGDVSVFSR